MSAGVVRYLVHGRVQGVGFRWFVRREADRLGLAGYVRNLPDGTVEVVARGEPSELTLLERVLERGPAFAHVDDVEMSYLPHDIELSKFFDIK